MIKIEFLKFKQVFSVTPQDFYAEVYWALDGAIFMSVLCVCGRRKTGRAHQM